MLSIPENIKLSDESYNEPKQIVVMLEAELFYSLLMNGTIMLDHTLPVLKETVCEWVISGNLALEPKGQKTLCNVSLHVSNKMLNDQLTNFWKIEN